MAAAEPTEELTSFSEYNSDMVTLAAPGAEILSTVQPEEAWYLPDATRGNDNSFYESFEEEAFHVTVVQKAPDSEDADNEKEDPPVRYTVTTNRAMTGSHALELKPDPAAMASDPDDDRNEYCWLYLTLHGVKNPGRYLGLSFYGSSFAAITKYQWPGESEEDEAPASAPKGKMYYLPCLTDHSDCGVLLAFDPVAGAWKTLSPLPKPTYFCFAAAFEGKLVVKGITNEDPDKEETEAVVWVYDPAADSWSKASAEGVLVRQTLFAGEDGLLLAGSGKKGPGDRGA